MAWNTIAPLGSVSVRANRQRLQDNTTYIETTMGNSIVGVNTTTTRDHFWNVGANEDGRHRFIQSPRYTSTAASPNDVYPILGTGMDIVLFPLATAGGVELFRKNTGANADNANAIFQVTPHFMIGTFTIISKSTSDYITIATLPPNVWGEIFMFFDGDFSRSASGWFSTTDTQCRGFTTRVKSTSTQQDEYAIQLRNDTTGTLDLQGTGGDYSGSQLTGTWHYRIIYRAF